MEEATIPGNATAILARVRKLVVELAVAERMSEAGEQPRPMATLVKHLGDFKGLSLEVEQTAKSLENEPQGLVQKNHHERCSQYEKALRMFLRNQPNDLGPDVVKTYLMVETSSEARATRRALLATAGLAFLVFAFPASSPEFSGFGIEIAGGRILVSAFLLVVVYQSAALFLENQAAVIDRAAAVIKMDALVVPVEVANRVLGQFRRSFPDFETDANSWVKGAEAKLAVHRRQVVLGKLKRVWAFEFAYLAAVAVILLGGHRLYAGWPVPDPVASFEEQALTEMRGINRALAEHDEQRELVDAVHGLQAELAKLTAGREKGGADGAQSGEDATAAPEEGKGRKAPKDSDPE